ncbi:hypothetical protein [Candidatus Spongiihabitans sp.]|uniref:hypothetical protein n=1 Tax=Candidatus Spongiihabitans sp. TaxID=3101308 RepID=UPI003C7D12A5
MIAANAAGNESGALPAVIARPILLLAGQSSGIFVTRSVTPYFSVTLASQRNYPRPIYRCLPNLSFSPQAGIQTRRSRANGGGFTAI